MNNQDYKKLEEITGYHFKDETLLIHALSHTSYANEKGDGHLGSNERLEFLGDAVLELVSSIFLFDKYENNPEGELTKKRAAYVCEAALDECAKRISFADYILLGKGEEQSGGRKRPSIVSDAFESYIGAIYLDGGFDEAKKFIDRFILSNDNAADAFHNSKSKLQELVQKDGSTEPEYRLISESGPDHDKTFTVEVLIGGQVMGHGSDSSKKHAEQKAAFEAINKLSKA